MTFSEVFMRNVLGIRQKAFVGLPVEGQPDAQFDVVFFDASISETHSTTASIVQHPIETGGNITDHYRGNADELQMDVVVSDTPIRFLSLLRPGDPTVDPERQRNGKRSIDAYERLRAFIDEASVVDIFTTLRTYKSMALESISVVRDASTGNALRASLRFKEIVIVSTETEQIKPKPRPKQKSRETKTKNGTTPAAEASQANANNGTTIGRFTLDSARALGRSIGGAPTPLPPTP
jgi:hypothetical protein